MDLNLPPPDACTYVQIASQAQGFSIGQQITLQGHKARVIAFGCSGTRELGAWLEIEIDRAAGHVVTRHVTLADLAAELRKGGPL